MKWLKSASYTLSLYTLALCTTAMGLFSLEKCAKRVEKRTADDAVQGGKGKIIRAGDVVVEPLVTRLPASRPTHGPVIVCIGLSLRKAQCNDYVLFVAVWGVPNRVKRMPIATEASTNGPTTPVTSFRRTRTKKSSFFRSRSTTILPATASRSNLRSASHSSSGTHARAIRVCRELWMHSQNRRAFTSCRPGTPTA